MLNRIALCSVEWQYPLLLKPLSNGGNGDSLNHHHLNSNVRGSIVMVVFRCLCYENKVAGVCCDLNVSH